MECVNYIQSKTWPTVDCTGGGRMMENEREHGFLLDVELVETRM